MPKYNFPPFTESDRVTLLDIIDPVITVQQESIVIKPPLMQIEVDIVMELPNGSKLGYRLTDIPVQNMEYMGYENLYNTVMAKMVDYEVTGV